MHSLILAWASWVLASLMPAQHTEVDFYSERFELAYRAEVFANGPLEISEEGLSYHYNEVTQKDWMELHEQLQSKRRDWQLNDWLYFKLVNRSVEQMASFMSENERRLLEFHLLSLSGFDTRICYSGQQVFVYVYTTDPLFEVPMINEAGRRYVNLTAALQPRNHNTRSLRMHSLRIQPEGKPFSFALDAFPKLKPQPKERVFRFRYQDELFTIHALSDLTIVAWMNEYPFFSEGRYVETPLSDATRTRLLSELRPLLEGKTEKESLELLAAFTRSAFVYKEDKKSFGYSKPMISDEVLYYPVSDCEDRSALYFNLVKDLLDLPVIAIAYDDHLSIAVSSDELKGRPYQHEGRTYYVCDPTGPAGSSEIGNPPYGYAHKRFEVVASHSPISLAQN